MTFNRLLRVRRRAVVGRWVDGAELAVSRRARRLLGNTYQYCNPPGKLSQDIAFVERAGGPHPIIDDKQTGTTTVSAISW